MNESPQNKVTMAELRVLYVILNKMSKSQLKTILLLIEILLEED